MTCNGPNTSPDETSDLSAELCHLLSEQIACARKGNLTQVERLFARTDALVARIAESGDQDSVSMRSRKAALQRLCDEMTLVLQAQCDDVRGRLKRLRQVKRALGAYREGAERV